MSDTGEPPSNTPDWARVKWRSLRMNRPHECSFCGQSMGPGVERLIVVDDGGYRAELCLRCMKRFCPGLIPPDRKRF